MPGFFLLRPIKSEEREIEEGVVKQEGTRCWRFGRTQIFQPLLIPIAKNEKACSGENSDGVAVQYLLKRLRVWLGVPISHPGGSAPILN